MAHPLRLQRKRTKGSRLPEGTICCTRPGRWGNPFATAEAFRAWLESGEVYLSELRDKSLFHWTPQSAARLKGLREQFLAGLPLLRGRQLACFCGLDRECHVDCLAEMANR